MHNIRESMKSAEQLQTALAQRASNLRAKASGEPLPFPNPWDSLMQKLPEDATREERRRWIADLFDRHAPRR